jgi:hypothetical protein
LGIGQHRRGLVEELLRLQSALEHSSAREALTEAPCWEENRTVADKRSFMLAAGQNPPPLRSAHSPVRRPAAPLALTI